MMLLEVGKLYEFKGEGWLHAERGLTDDDDDRVLSRSVYPVVYPIHPKTLLVLLEKQVWARTLLSEEVTHIWLLRFLCNDFVGYLRLSERSIPMYFSEVLG